MKSLACLSSQESGPDGIYFQKHTNSFDHKTSHKLHPRIKPNASL